MSKPTEYQLEIIRQLANGKTLSAPLTRASTGRAIGMGVFKLNGTAVSMNTVCSMKSKKLISTKEYRDSAVATLTKRGRKLTK